MVFGHAPVILPAVLRVPLPYHPVLYLPLVLLHGALVLRILLGEPLAVGRGVPARRRAERGCAASLPRTGGCGGGARWASEAGRAEALGRRATRPLGPFFRAGCRRAGEVDRARRGGPGHPWSFPGEDDARLVDGPKRARHVSIGAHRGVARLASQPAFPCYYVG